MVMTTGAVGLTAGVAAGDAAAVVVVIVSVVITMVFMESGDGGCHATVVIVFVESSAVDAGVSLLLYCYVFCLLISGRERGSASSSPWLTHGKCTLL